MTTDITTRIITNVINQRRLPREHWMKRTSAIVELSNRYDLLKDKEWLCGTEDIVVDNRIHLSQSDHLEFRIVRLVTRCWLKFYLTALDFKHCCKD